MPKLYQFKFQKSYHNDDYDELYEDYRIISEELKGDDVLPKALKLALTHYVAPSDSPLNPNQEQCSDVALFPHACSYFQLPNGYSVLSQTVAKEPVGNEEEGNFFTHAYIFDSDALFEYIYPFDPYKDNKFSFELNDDHHDQTKPVYLKTYHYKGKRLEEIRKNRQEQRDVFFRLQDSFSTKSKKEVTRPKRLIKAILAMLQCDDDKPHVIVVTGEEKPLELLERTFALLPLGVAKRIEFITYSGDLDQEIRPCVGKTEDPDGVFKDLPSGSDKVPECRNILVVFVPHDVFQVEKDKYYDNESRQMRFLEFQQSTPEVNVSVEDFTIFKSNLEPQEIIVETEDEKNDKSVYLDSDMLSQALDVYLDVLAPDFFDKRKRPEVAQTLDLFASLCNLLQTLQGKHTVENELDISSYAPILAEQDDEFYKKLYQTLLKFNNKAYIKAFIDCIPEDKLACLVQQALAHMCKLNEEQLKKWLPEFYEKNGNFTQIIVCICSHCCDKLIELLNEGADSTPERQAVSDHSIFLLAQILFDKIYDKSSRDRESNKNFPKFIDYLNPELVCVFFWRVLKLAVSQDDPEKVLDKNEQAFILRELFHAWDKIKSDLTPPEEFISQLCNTLYDFWTKELYSLSSHPYSDMFAFWHGYFGKYHAKKDNFFADVFERQISDKLYFPNPNDQSNGINLAYNCGLTTYVLYLSGKTLQNALKEVKEEREKALNAFAAIPDNSRMNFRNAKEITKKPETIDALAQYCRLVALADFLGEKCGEPSAKAPNLTALGSQKNWSRN